MLRIVLSFMLGTVLSVSASAQELHTGVRFSSYNVEPESRTEIQIPYGKSPISFKDQFNLSFKVAFVPGHEQFGYISRLVFSPDISADIILVNPAHALPYISFVYAGEEVGGYEIKDPDTFKTIDLSVSANTRRLEISVDEDNVASAFLNGIHSQVTVSFGACTIRGFDTMDCAPIIIKDIKVNRNPNRKPYFWPLDYIHTSGKVMDRTGGLACNIRNASWEIQRHCSWVKIDSMTFSGKVFPALSQYAPTAFFVGENSVTEYNLRNSSSILYSGTAPVSVAKITNNFIVDKSGLMYYDITSAGIRTFSRQNRDWDGPIIRDSHSPYLFSNAFHDRRHHRIIHLFGYGFHLYNNSILTLDTKTGKVTDKSSSIINPRYLSGAGVNGRKMYIYGGKGNPSGRQELGTTIFNDLYVLNLSNLEVERHFLGIDLESEVAVKSLIVKDSSFFSLFFDPSKKRTQLQLKQVSLLDGSVTALADPIPFTFHDTDSYADIMEDPVDCSYYAITLGRIDNGYKAEMWSLAYPILPVSQTIYSSRNHALLWILLALLLSAAAAFFFIYGRFRERTAESGDDAQDCDEITPAQEPVLPGLYLLGGFRAIDKNGVDITRQFTPMMKQLLALIILNSEGTHGLSNEQMQEALWPDKSKDSFFNNRSVNVRKIRLALEQIGDQNISSNDTFWVFNEGASAICDYIHAIRLLQDIDSDRATREDIELVLHVALRGTLLSFIQADCFDQFKSNYSDNMIAMLSKLRDSAIAKADVKLRKRICDAILLFDSIDESTVAIKCACLMSQKRAGVSKSVFSNFTKEYARLMGEPFELSFTEFLKNQHE